MGVIRKSLSFAVTLSLVLSSVPLTSFADEAEPRQSKPNKPVQRTAFGFDKDKVNFCEAAPNMMKRLGAANESKMQRLGELKEEIEDVTARMSMLNSMGAYRDAYLKGLKALSDTKTPAGIAQAKKDKLENLDNMKKVIRNGLVLNAIGLLLKNGDLDKEDSFSVSSICANKENISQTVCKKEDKFSSLTQAGKSQDEIGYFSPWLGQHPLDDTLMKFKNAYSHVSAGNKKDLQADLQAVLDSIPDNIGPEAIFKVLDSTAPGITALLKTDENKDTLTKCLSEKSNASTLSACEKLLPVVGQADNFLGKMTEVTKAEFTKKMSDQTDQAVAKIKDISTLIDEGSKQNLANLNKQIDTYKVLQNPVAAAASKFTPGIQNANITLQQTANKLASDTNAKLANFDTKKETDAAKSFDKFKTMQQQTSLDSLGSTRLFIRPELEVTAASPTEASSENSPAIIEAKKTEESWKTKCSPVKSNDDMKFCQDTMALVETNLSNEKNQFKQRLQSLQNEIAKVTVNGDGRFGNIETMKKFILQKYMKSCKNNASLKSKSENIGFAIELDGVCYGSSQHITTIDSLGNDMDGIKVALDVQTDKSENSFDIDQVNEFAKACGSTSPEEFGDICGVINKEKSTAREKEVERKKSIPVNEDKDYWVTSNGHGGFNKVAKKSTLRIVGEGVLPVVPQMIPMFFQNYAMTANISMLTDQALYQKQMLYNYNLYNTSPWLYNYGPYGTIPGYGSPFATTTTTTTTGTATSTAGFGF